MREATTKPEFELSISSRGLRDELAVEYAREKLFQAARAAPAPILFGRLKLTLEPHRSVERPAYAEAMLDMNGRAVRAHVAAETITEAADLLEQRLRRQLNILQRRREHMRVQTGVSGTGEWRHADLPSRRPSHYPRPVEERKIIRRKTFSLGHITPEEAVTEMELLDHDFHLFLDSESGDEALVYRRGDGGYALTLAGGSEPADRGDMRVDPQQPPRLALSDAVGRLNVGGEPFLFFVNYEDDRANVLYRRYDGHYGVVAAT